MKTEEMRTEYVEVNRKMYQLLKEVDRVYVEAMQRNMKHKGGNAQEDEKYLKKVKEYLEMANSKLQFISYEEGEKK